MNNRRTIAGSVLLAGFLLSVANPAQARFLQADPIGYKGDLNLYTYVGNDPTNKFDPKGLWECSQQGGCSGTQNALKLLRSLTPEQKAKLSQTLQNKLAKVLNFYGKDNTANHVTVVEDPNRWAGRTTTSGGETTVHIGSAGGVGATAGVVAHEGWHGVDETQRWGGRDPANLHEEFDTEVRAYTLQAGVNRATNTTSSVFSPGDSADTIQNKIYNMAFGSTAATTSRDVLESPESQSYMSTHSEAQW